MTVETLAIFGGNPVSSEPWPQWPAPVDLRHESRLKEVLESGVWAISGRSNGQRLQCQQFREEFAEFIGRRWCVETDHGTSALVTALEALGIGPGDEVIVPDLTWVACATAVLQVGATPVFADVDPKTFCVTSETVQARLTEKSKCILVVHLSCTTADMRSLMRLAKDEGVYVLEDCAQAHGARWSDGRMVGTHGDLSVFSFQNGKALTAGEGGAVVGDDETLRRRVEAARADGRELQTGTPEIGEMYLAESETLMGTNYCLSEISAALLRVGLERLPAETDRRHENAARLDELFSGTGFSTVCVNPALAVRSVYEFGVLLDEDRFGESNPAAVREAVTRELQTQVYEIDPPLHMSKLYRPESKPRFEQHAERNRLNFPVAEHAHRYLCMIHHSVLLAHPRRMREIVTAFEKVAAHRTKLS